jgi:hypothetical protein
MQTWDMNDNVWNMKAIIRPSSALAITAEQRCFNGNTGTNTLWVNDQLAAYSTLDTQSSADIMNVGAEGEIFDCHGKRLWRTIYDSRLSQNAQLNVYSDDDTLIYTSNFPIDPSESKSPQLVYSQPDNVV